jgi:hypothetical protein
MIQIRSGPRSFFLALPFGGWLHPIGQNFTDFLPTVIGLLGSIFATVTVVKVDSVNLGIQTPFPRERPGPDPVSHHQRKSWLGGKLANAFILSVGRKLKYSACESPNSIIIRFLPL